MDRIHLFPFQTEDRRGWSILRWISWDSWQRPWECIRQSIILLQRMSSFSQFHLETRKIAWRCCKSCPNADRRMTAFSSRSWNWFWVLACLLLMGLIYWETALSIVQEWFTYGGSHGLLILGITVYIIWQKREHLRRADKAPNFLRGSLILMIGCLAVIAGRFSCTDLLEKISLIVTLLGAVDLILGRQVFSLLLVPVSYLIFSFSFADTLLGRYVLYFQLASSSIASNLLALVGMPVHQDGVFIALPHISLEVARECSGVNHITALAAFSVPLAYATQRGRAGRALIVIVSFFVGVLANGIRITVIGLWTGLDHQAAVHGPFDVFLVSFVFGLGLLILLILSVLLGTIGGNDMGNNKRQASDLECETAEGGFRYGGAVAATAAFLSTIFVLSFFQPEPVYPGKLLTMVPMTIGDWKGEDRQMLDVCFESVRADNDLKRVYRNAGGQEVAVYVGYYNRQRPGHEIFDSRYGCITANGAPLAVSLGDGRNAKVNRVKARDGTKAYFAYFIDKHFIEDKYRVKFRIIKNILLKRTSEGSIVIVIPRESKLSGIHESLEPHINFLDDLIRSLEL